MRILFILITALFLTACEELGSDLDFYTVKRPSYKIDEDKYGDVINREASSPGALIRKRASEVYDLEYFVAMGHKAIAQSDSGAWGWSEDWGTPDSAIDRALELCRKTNHQPERPCKIINIDGFWATDFYKNK